MVHIVSLDVDGGSRHNTAYARRIVPGQSAGHVLLGHDSPSGYAARLEVCCVRCGKPCTLGTTGERLRCNPKDNIVNAERCHDV